MIYYSQTHEALIADMVTEMLRFGDFQPGVIQRIREIGNAGGAIDLSELRVVDDLYGIYADQDVVDD